MRRIRNPRYAPEFLERKLNPNGAYAIPVPAAYATFDTASDADATPDDDPPAPPGVTEDPTDPDPSSGDTTPEPPGPTDPDTPGDGDGDPPTDPYPLPPPGPAGPA